MSKLITAFLILAILLAWVGAWMEGGGGVIAVQLTSPMTTTSTQIPVADTTGFLAADVLSIDNEYIYYGAKAATNFNTLTRGFYDTQAASHATGTYVYTYTASTINYALGYNLGAITVQNGLFAAPMVVWNFFAITLPHLISFNHPMFTGELVIVRYLFMAAGIGFMITIALGIGATIAYALRR